MKEYIERDALMLRIKEIHCTECDSHNGLRCRACWVDDTLDYIDSEPAADVAPVRHGRWELVEYQCTPLDTDQTLVCTECGFAHQNDDWYNYCPNCGAKMDGDENG